MIETIKKIPGLGPIVKRIGQWRRDRKENARVQDLWRKNSLLLERNKVLKNSLAGKRVFILATGPSVATQDLKALAGEACISVSNFFVHPDFLLIKPAFHLFASSHRPISAEQFKAWFTDAERHFPAGQKVFVSITDKPIVEDSGLFKKQNHHYYLLGNKKTDTLAEVDFTFPIPKTQTVVHHAILLAFYLGCKEICLVGVDHDWITHVGQSVHFYKENEHAMVRAGYKERKMIDNQGRFKAYDNLFERYKEMQRYAEKRGIKIINCTPGGLLDVFPRKALSDVINSDSSK